MHAERPRTSPSDVYRAPCVQALLTHLLGAHRCADILARSPWDFASGLADLRKTGVADALLRVLIADGCLEHRVEVPGTEGRSLRWAANSDWGPGSLFVLTPRGVVLTQELTEAPEVPLVVPTLEEAGAPVIPAPAGTPVWERRLRELRYQGALVKRIRRSAPNQEAVLDALEEMGWPERMDDPLPQDKVMLPEDRLRETIKSLNRGQRPLRIHFLSEANGSGVRWEVMR
jgi:hypothetical protein